MNDSKSDRLTPRSARAPLIVSLIWLSSISVISSSRCSRCTRLSYRRTRAERSLDQLALVRDRRVLGVDQRRGTADGRLAASGTRREFVPKSLETAPIRVHALVRGSFDNGAVEPSSAVRGVCGGAPPEREVAGSNPAGRACGEPTELRQFPLLVPVFDPGGADTTCGRASATRPRYLDRTSCRGSSRFSARSASMWSASR